MVSSERKTVKVEQRFAASAVRHPMEPAKLLYSVPKFILRGPIYLIFVITFAAIFYSFWARNDILVVAPLTLETESMFIEAIGAGQVVDIRVKENSYVETGDIFLVVQEQTRAAMTTEQESFESKVEEIKQAKEKLINEYSHNIAQLQMDLGDMKENKETRKITVQGKIAQLNEKLKTANREKTLRKKEYDTALAQFERIKARFERRDVTITKYEAAEQGMNRRRKLVSDAQATISELKVSLSTARKELATLTDLHGLDKLEQELSQLEIRRDRELKRMDDRIASTQSRMKKSQTLVEGVSFKENLTEYKSTFDGLVTGFHVNKGEIINPGTRLVTIVKDTAALEGRLLIQNKDIGKLKIGQRVQIKYYAFPFQDYGIPNGTMYDIAKRPGGVKGQETKYVVKVALDKETISKIGSRREQPLEIGLEGVGEIKTGEKRWIELLFKPVSRFFTQDED